MKKIKIYKKLLILLAAGTLSFQTVGCGDTKEEIILENNIDDEKDNEITNEDNNNTETNNKDAQNNEMTTEEKNMEVLKKVDEWMSDTNNIINYEKMDNLNKSIEESLIKMTDFVVFGGTITLDNGEEITLKECSQETISKVESVYSLIIAKVEEKFPGTTSKLGDYFNRTKEFTKEKAKDAKEYLGDKMDEYIDSGYKNGYYDESTYDFMKQFKKGIGPQIKEDWNQGKDTIKDLYSKGKNAWNNYLNERENIKTK